MKRTQWREVLEARMAPAEKCPWDNDGLLVCRTDREVQRVLLTLDVTPAAVEEACRLGCDAILSHHPLIFHPLSAVTPEAPVSRTVLRLLQEDIAVLSYHTRLDAAPGGVNDTLAALLGITHTRPLGEGELAMGRMGLVEETTPAAFAARVKEILGAPAVLLADGGRPVRRVALLGGEGKDFVEGARLAGADLFLSGHVGYHAMADAVGEGMSLVEAGHYHTEAPVLQTLAAWLQEADPQVQIHCHASFGMCAI